MKRIIMSCLVLLMGLNTSSYALELPQEYREETKLTETEIVEMYYEKNTITFDDNVDSISELHSSADAIVESAHKQNIEAAKDYVLSMNLKNSGLELTETACLQELDALEEMSDVTLLSYTVLTPNAQMKAVQANNLMYFGTKNGRDFYYNLTSQSSIEAKKTSNRTQATLQNWVDGAVNIALCYASTTYTVPYTVFKTILGTPTGWTVQKDSYVENYVRLNPTTRNIYTEISPGTWRTLLSNQTGTADLTTVFHSMDDNYPHITARDAGRLPIETGEYSNKSTLLNMAYSQWENSAYGNDPYTQTLLQYLPAYSVRWN